jgi:hypothetical protein
MTFMTWGSSRQFPLFEQARRQQAVDDTEDERGDGEKRDHQKQAIVGNQP